MAIVFYLMLLSKVLGGIYSPYLEGSFESTHEYYARGEEFSGNPRMEISEIVWKGERVSKQIIIWSAFRKVGDIQFVISDFKSERHVIRAENAYLRLIDYAKTDRESRGCSRFPSRDPKVFKEMGDILSEKKATMVEPGMPLRLWVTINVPRSAADGLYSGTVSVLADGSSALDFRIDLQVVDYQLPEISDWEFHLDLWQYPTAVVDRYNDPLPPSRIKYWSEEHFILLEPKYRLLADMGQKVITAHIKEGALGAASMVTWIRKPDGSWTYDYSAFDRYVDSLMRWGIDKQISCHSPVGWNKDVIPYWDERTSTMIGLTAPPGSKEYEERWDHFLTRFKMHLDSGNLFSRTVLYLDEVEMPALNGVIRMIKNNHQDWKIGMAGFHTPTSYVDTNVYDMSLMVGIPGNDQRSDGLCTFYLSCNPPHPNSFISGDAMPAENIWIAWHALHMGYQGFLRWAYDNWLENDPTEMRTGGHTSGDFALCYRSSNALDMQVYSSVRLELIREGIQDFEKVCWLRKEFENSGRAEDRHSLFLLNHKINEFTAASGGSQAVTELVLGAQKLLGDLVSRNHRE